MSELYVYTTEGVCIYPKDGEDDPSINQYFEAVNFTVNLRHPSRPTMEAYFRAILPSGRPEQLFLRFQGDDPATLFEDCKATIRRELVEEHGWNVRKETDKTDPGMILQRAVIDPVTSPRETFDRNVASSLDELVRTAQVDSVGSLAVHSRDFEAIGDFIRAVGDEPVLIAVTESDISIGDADIVLRKRPQSSRITFPEETRHALAQSPEPRETDADIDPALEGIRSHLDEINEANVDDRVVKESLNDVLSDAYPSLSVREDEEEGVAVGQKTPMVPDSDASGSSTSGSDSGRASGSAPGTPGTSGSDDDAPIPGLGSPPQGSGSTSGLSGILDRFLPSDEQSRKYLRIAGVAVLGVLLVFGVWQIAEFGTPGSPGANGTATPEVTSAPTPEPGGDTPTSEPEEGSPTPGSGGESSPSPSGSGQESQVNAIASALNENDDDNKLNTDEIQQAVDYHVNEDSVEGLQQGINNTEMEELKQMWKNDTAITTEESDQQ